MTGFIARLATFLALCSGPTSCTKSHSSPPAGPQGNGQPLTAQSSNLGLLTISAELREDGLLLHVAGIPAGSTLECTLDQTPLLPCADLGIYARPATGDHKISASATQGGIVTALGESPVFTVLPGASGTLTTGDTLGLGLALDEPTFTNGAAVPLTKDFAVHFKLQAKPSCDTPQVKCKYDSQSSPFWSNCDDGAKAFSVAKEHLALGLQYLSVQASCGDKSGPVLNVFWYGVPDGYQPLGLREIADTNGLHSVDLVKQEDCPGGTPRVYECAEAGADAFAPCASNSNSVNQPAPGYRIRLVCGQTVGPALAFGA